MKKFILMLILFSTIGFSQNRFGKNNKSGSIQKNVAREMSNTNTVSVPRRISYQGLITKTDGSPTDDGSYEILFKVFGSADGGEPVWSENQEVTVNNGIISTILGNTNPFTVIPQEAFLELTVDGSTLSPRQVLTSVFYAVLSDTADYARTADYDELIDLPDLNVYVLKDSLESYTTSSDLYDTLSAYQRIDSNLTDLTEDGVLSGSKVEYGITSSNADAMKTSENPAIKRLVGAEGELGAAFGLDNDWSLRIIKQVGNYGESYKRNIADTGILPDRGPNQLWTKGGILYVPPAR